MKGSVVETANAMDVALIDLFHADQMLKDVNSFDKSLAEKKLAFIEGLDKKDFIREKTKGRPFERP